MDPGLVRALHHAERALGVRLRELRRRAGLSQEAAAERAYLSPKQLRRLELGQANATMASLVACARAYRVTLADLFVSEQIDESLFGPRPDRESDDEHASPDAPKRRRRRA